MAEKDTKAEEAKAPKKSKPKLLLVVGVGKTKRDHAARAKRLLEKANARVLGAVLYNVKTDESLYRY